jgi:hypothetical protein
MPESIRIIGAALPGARKVFRCPEKLALDRDLNALYRYHLYNHHAEKLIHPKITLDRAAQTCLFDYELFGYTPNIMQTFIRELDKKICVPPAEIAALKLERTFGVGRVRWDKKNDRIIAETKEGFLLALAGTNLVEAGVYLPRLYKAILERLPAIKEGVSLVEVRIEGEQEFWSRAASPLKVKLTLPNLEHVTLADLNLVVKQAVDRAVSTRLPS